MKQFIPVFLFAFLILLGHTSKADDILIPLGENLPGAPAWKYKGGGTNLDAVSWKSLAYAEPGWLTGNSAFGFGGSPVRNTEIPENTTAGGGGISTSRYPTMYFRKVINIASVAAYSSFSLRAQFDDAIVIWINGVEAYRNNIPANPSYATLATTAIAGNGSTVYTATLNSSLFINGDNIIAVEIHQNSATSSDLFFDMELTGVTSLPDEVLVPFGSNLAGAPAWKYKGGGTNLDAVAWKTSGYAEPGWVTGNSALGFGGGPVRNTNIPENTTAGGGGASGSRYPTMYFRKVVNIPDPTTFAAFRINAMFDDGIAIYINGNEVFRNNLPAGATYSTWAPSAITNNGADVYTAVISKTNFVAGNNIIAVEVHQNSATSSDLFFDMELIGLNSSTTTLTRGPYLQMGTKTSVTIRWRTDLPADSKVKWGNAFGNYTDSVISATETTEHEVNITGLTPDTKYFYSIGSTSQILQATALNYVTTLPPDNTTRKLRFLALGDCGNASTNQVDVKNAFINYIGSNDVDAILTVGDNAYSSGLDTEFQNGFFNMYKNDILRNKKLYMNTGNHDYGNSSANTGVRNNAYYNSFTLPTNGEIGGLASGTEAYYSYNIGDVHFVALDSYGREDGNTTKMYDTTGAQCVWLKNDLAANTKKWTVVYFHHPPYTKTSHNSDTETADLMLIRERFIRILERYGVDLVLTGHSHGYERSYLLKNYFNNPSSPLLDANFRKNLHTADSSNGMYNGTANSCAYTYESGQINHGSVYIVAGSSGQIGGSATGYPHDAMYYSNNTNGGAFYFEVDSNRLDAKFLSYSGTGAGVTPVVRDQFTIFKDVDKVTDITVAQNTPLNLTASWRGSYYWPNNGGASTQSVSVNTAVPGVYNFIVQDFSTANCLKDSFRVTVTTVLPVSLTSFTAQIVNDRVQLDWATSQEVNNRNFTLEKSTDGVNFNFLQDISGAGNSSSPRSYRATDISPVNGYNYYRLSQTNFDGLKTFFETRKVNYKNNRLLNATVLNMGNGRVNVVINCAQDDNITMRIVDILGYEVSSQRFVMNAGSVTKSLQLSSGTYVMMLSGSSGERLTTKIIIR